jgi:protein-disulfide isomerase
MKQLKDVTLILSLSINFGVLFAGAWVYYARRAPQGGAAAPAAVEVLTSAADAAPIAAALPAAVPVATEGHPSRGPADASVTIVEFSDFECPFCARVTPVMAEIEAAYAGQVRRVFRQFPLMAIHPRARMAAVASLCAHEQGRFWEMHEALFEQPLALDRADLERNAERTGLTTAAFARCLASGKYDAQVEKDLDEGVRAGVTGTPAVFINGRLLSGARPYADFAAVIDAELNALGR